MDLGQLAQLGEFVGGIVVVVSLIYVAYQVRQNTKSLRTENYARVLDRMSTLQSRLAADAELNRIFVVGAEDPGRLSRSERIRFTWALYELFGAGEFMYHQSRENALPAAVWERWDKTICWWLSHPGMRLWWTSKPAPLAADFEAFVDDVIRSRVATPESLARWHGFVAGDASVLAVEAAVTTHQPAETP
jgi:hypothetical protein